MGETAPGRISIRRAAREDASAIYRISEASFTDSWREETILEDLLKDHSLYLVCLREDRIVGYACYWFVLDEAQLVNVAVLPENRKQGLAKKLLEEGLAEARKRHMKTMFLEVRAGNLPAQALYRKYGFSVITLRKAVYEMPREDGYIMKKSL
ncbi:MAG: ribosomal protein S18-alanine N-acetyltransferase [Dialister sp.]|nr:ribosomal protein S18-alanine N-acetyltransferase [Dialister sp.]